MSAQTAAAASDRVDFPGGVSLLVPVTVACGQFMSSLDQNVVVTALPGIGESLHEPASHLGLVITAYVASLIICMPLGSWAADRFGVRRSYCAAVLVFGLASILCGMATNMATMIGARALQGFGGALMGLAGAFLTMAQFNAFTFGVVSGRGWVAIALVVFGRWDPWRSAGAALLFAFVDALQLRLQAAGLGHIPYEAFLMLPFVLTIVAMAFMSRNAVAPTALLKPFRREER